MKKLTVRSKNTSSQVKEEIRKLEDCRTHFKAFQPHLAKVAKGYLDEIEGIKLWIDGMEEYSSLLQAHHESVFLSDLLTSLGKFHTVQTEQIQALSEGLGTTLTSSFVEYIKGDIKEARNSKIFDKKAKDEEEEQQIAQETYKILSLVNLKTEYTSLELFLQYYDLHCNFFNNCLQELKNMEPEIATVKEIINKRKEEYNKQYQLSQASSDPSESPTKVFGLSLSRLLEREGKDIPTFIEKAVEYLQNNALKQEGIFRVSAQKNELQEYKDSIDAGNEPDFSTVTDPHIVTGLLKLYLRELPEPIITQNLFDKILSTNKFDNPETSNKVLRHLLQTQLNPVHYRVLRAIMQLLVEIIAFTEFNKMDANNLAIVLAPNMLYSDNPDPAKMAEQTAGSNSIIAKMIRNFDVIFDQLEGGKGNRIQRGVMSVGTSTPTQSRKQQPQSESSIASSLSSNSDFTDLNSSLNFSLPTSSFPPPPNLDISDLPPPPFDLPPPPTDLPPPPTNLPPPPVDLLPPPPPLTLPPSLSLSSSSIPPPPPPPPPLSLLELSKPRDSPRKERKEKSSKDKDKDKDKEKEKDKDKDKEKKSSSSSSSSSSKGHKRTSSHGGSGKIVPKSSSSSSASILSETPVEQSPRTQSGSRLGPKSHSSKAINELSKPQPSSLIQTPGSNKDSPANSPSTSAPLVPIRPANSGSLRGVKKPISFDDSNTSTSTISAEEKKKQERKAKRLSTIDMSKRIVQE